MSKGRLSIRRKVYRGREGFLVSGNVGGIFGTSIFTETRESAEHIKAKVLRGEEITSQDFAIGGNVVAFPGAVS